MPKAEPIQVSTPPVTLPVTPASGTTQKDSDKNKKVDIALAKRLAKQLQTDQDSTTDDETLLERDEKRNKQKKLEKKKKLREQLKTFKINRIVYSATKIKFSGFFRKLGKVLLRVLFPPLLIWDVLQFTFSRLFGERFMRFILGTFDTNHHDEAPKLTEQIRKDPELRCSFMKVKTPEGHTLDGLEIAYNKPHDFVRAKAKKDYTQHIADKNRPYIIKLAGHGSSYINFSKEIQHIAKRAKGTVVACDYRSVNKSTGRALSLFDVSKDVIYQIQRILKMGIPAHHIFIDGHSLGAAIGALVATHFQNKGKKVNLYYARSFSSTSIGIRGLIQERFFSKRTFWTVALGWLLYPLIKLTFAICGCELNPAKLIAKLDPATVAIMNIYPPKHVKNRWLYADEAVSVQASMLYSQRTRTNKIERKYRKELEKIAQKFSKADLLHTKDGEYKNPYYHPAFINQPKLRPNLPPKPLRVQKAFLAPKYEYRYHKGVTFHGRHACGREYLVDRYGNTADDLYHDWINYRMGRPLQAVSFKKKSWVVYKKSGMIEPGYYKMKSGPTVFVRKDGVIRYNPERHVNQREPLPKLQPFPSD